MSNESSRLPPRAEALLAELSTSEIDWEAQAESIERRLVDVALGSTDAALLAAPLPQQPGEPEAPSPSLSTPPRTEPRFAELARKALPKSARHEASQLYKESLSVAAAARATSDATFERVRSVPSPAAPRVSSSPAASVTPAEESVSASAGTLSAAPVVQEPAATSRGPAAPAVPRGRGAGAPFFAGVGVSIAAAAALALFLQTRGPTEAPINAAEGSASSVANAPTSSPPAAPAQRSTAEAPAQGVPLDALPREGATTQAIPGSAAPGDPPPAQPPLATGSADAARVASTPRAAASGPGPAAGQAKVSSAGAADPTNTPPEPPTPKLRPAAGASGGLADKPSTGAIQAALGSVMTSARRCLAGSPTAASAVVVFGADGAVRNVTVTPGGAAAACVESALSQARVAPFAARSFSVKVPVRP